MLRDGGFKNISIDLIAGLPYQTIDQWRFNVAEAIKLQTDHISVYMLEIHEGTSLFHQVNRGEVVRPDDDLSLQMYYELIDSATTAGLAQYEISNFARGPAFQSRHNMKYWSDVPYYGFGCGAHAYDGQSRWWNCKPPHQYIEKINATGKAISEINPLSDRERMQEAIFLGLRRMSGIDLSYFQNRYGVNIASEYEEDLDRFFAANLIELSNNTIRLTRQGLALSNEVFAAFV
jgi:oxygen-independent coproporphyrinogen-3 oxidase